MAQINKSTEYFNTKLYTGNSSTNAITGVGFQPDLVWIKSRSVIRDHVLTDSVRGIASQIHSNTTDAESTYTNDVTSFDSDGFTVSTDSDVNGDTFTYASWNWLASNTTASNTDGSITSTVSANTTSGFSIGTYTGTNVDNTVGHGLGVAPDVIMVKCTSTAHDWVVYHSALGSGSAIALNLTDASYGATGWQNTEPTSTVFSIDNAANSVNQSGQSFVFYAFAEKKGFSKFGSYVGNGSTDGSFIYTGFKPAFVMIKVSSTTNDWSMYDNQRDPINQVDNYLQPNTSSAEVSDTGKGTDFLSNGFKLRTTHGTHNTSGATYIYMAFAESPLVGTNNTPAVAR
jgi:hypothetical protein